MRILIIICLFISLCAWSQDPTAYYLEVVPDQQVEILSGASGPSVNVPVLNGIVIIDGTYDSEGLGRSIVFNGSRLSIDSMTMGLDGWRYVVLRREDGRDFYNLFPTLQARMIPATQKVLADEAKKEIPKDTTNQNRTGN